ncbi:SDR family oxidoreductase [Variovorax paradoxus]|uniref:dTDP-glucose 4,6-dehydratase n=1 Tax=Variovorax paradoxus TaxID=34073 RepID=A0A0H2M7W6_VARPD|nr:SDR family oxidoreductase [Variovorax paradoxus]KLN56837.1 dTDP-glucose 4,6-dehydratase [Variovorax paradoxus]
MPSINSPSGALPARFRRERLLIVGCGDVGQRVARSLLGRVQLVALTSSSARVPALRVAGIRPLVGDLDDPATLRRLAGVATRVLHLAPPARDGGASWWRDQRTTALARALRLRSVPLAFVYGSTSGVYGDCGGARVSETRPVRPDTPRAHRRVDAERAVRWLGRSAGVRASILRIPGIYAPDREGGTPRQRLARGPPVLRREDDVFTSHIHADDLARACVAALFRGRPQRIVHASDDTELRMGDYIDLAADLYGMPRPPRVAREEAQRQLPLQLLSFMGESRRLDNTRLKRELRVRLAHPTVHTGLREAA